MLRLLTPHEAHQFKIIDTREVVHLDTTHVHARLVIMQDDTILVVINGDTYIME